MKKYQWNDANLKKKAQRYDWLMLGLAGIALASSQLIKGISGLVLLGLLVAAAACFVLSWRVKGQDAKLKNGKS